MALKRHPELDASTALEKMNKYRPGAVGYRKRLKNKVYTGEENDQFLIIHRLKQFPDTGLTREKLLMKINSWIAEQEKDHKQWTMPYLERRINQGKRRGLYVEAHRHTGFFIMINKWLLHNHSRNAIYRNCCNFLEPLPKLY